MNRRQLLIYMKVKVILFSLFVLFVPTVITYCVDSIVALMMFRTDIIDAFAVLPHEPWYKGLCYFYIQSLCIVFLYSLYFNMIKTLFVKNRDFFKT